MSQRGNAVGAVGVYAYALLSLLPVISVLPALMVVVIGDEPSWHAVFFRYWNVFAGVLLVVVATADSAVSEVSSARQMLLNVTGIVATMVIVTKVLQAPNSTFVLGVLFFIHSWRTLPLLWCGDRRWWLWTAWMRDGIMAILLFLGSATLSEAL